jgi:hypothetical protein
VASVQIGDSVQDDIKNSYLITMDEQVAVFASKVRQVSPSHVPLLSSPRLILGADNEAVHSCVCWWQDPQLANGFNAAGFSQVQAALLWSCASIMTGRLTRGPWNAGEPAHPRVH